ncbi:DUF4833 domain-containing protein [Bizionia sp. KMM 8389]
MQLAHKSQKKLSGTRFILAVLIFHLFVTIGHSQDNYPTPIKTSNRLFYIQHSNNFNTYIYDSNWTNNTLNLENPITAYRKIYTENGIERPLTSLQKKLAYGIEITQKKPHLITFTLAASGELNFYLEYNNNKTEAKVYTIINNQKMYLNRMFVQLKTGFFANNAKAEYVLFYGTLYDSGKLITEKVIID